MGIASDTSIKTTKVPNYARNTGIAAAGGEFIAFLDPDDLWAPSKLATQIEVVKSHTNAFLICTAVQKFGTDCLWAPHSRPNDVHEIGLAEVHLRNPIATSSVLISRQCIETVGHFTLGIRSEDWDMWMRIARAGKIFKVLEPLVGCRDHPQSRSRNVAKELPWAITVIESNFAKLPRNYYFSKLRHQALAMSYYGFSWLCSSQGEYCRAYWLLGNSIVAWPAGFPRSICKARFERLRYGLRLLKDSLLR